MNSTAMDPVTGDTDLKWVLYNLRYAMSSCLFGFPGNTSVQSTPCITSRACGPFQSNFAYNDLSPNITTYDYCVGLPAADATGRCNSCIRQGEDTFLPNYFTTILAGCANQQGMHMNLDGSLFGTDYVNVTYGFNLVNSPTSSTPTTMNLGTRIGIAIGSICALLALIGITIVCCGKRRRRARLAERARRAEEYNDFGSMQRVLPTPRVTTKWATDMSTVQDESPMTANTYLNDKHGFSPYSSRYNSPVSAREVPQPQQWEWPMQSANSVKNLAQGQQGYEMEKVRGGASVVTPVDKEQEDQRLHEEWAMEAAARGFTVAPVMGLPPPPPIARR